MNIHTPIDLDTDPDFECGLLLHAIGSATNSLIALAAKGQDIEIAPLIRAKADIDDLLFHLRNK